MKKDKEPSGGKPFAFFILFVSFDISALGYYQGCNDVWDNSYTAHAGEDNSCYPDDIYIYIEVCCNTCAYTCYHGAVPYSVKSFHGHPPYGVFVFNEIILFF